MPKRKSRVHGAAFLALCAIFSAAFLGCSKNQPHEFKIPPEAASRKNPFSVTPETIAEGRDLYVAGACAICHGKNGDGKGVLAKDVSMNLHNWRDPAVQADFSDGDLFYIMDKGRGTNRGRMPAYHDQNTPEQIWHMVCYIRSVPTSAPN